MIILPLRSILNQVVKFLSIQNSILSSIDSKVLTRSYSDILSKFKPGFVNSKGCDLEDKFLGVARDYGTEILGLEDYRLAQLDQTFQYYRVMTEANPMLQFLVNIPLALLMLVLLTYLPLVGLLAILACLLIIITGIDATIQRHDMGVTRRV
jgi:hypothetical protein